MHHFPTRLPSLASESRVCTFVKQAACGEYASDSPTALSLRESTTLPAVSRQATYQDQEETDRNKYKEDAKRPNAYCRKQKKEEDINKQKEEERGNSEALYPDLAATTIRNFEVREDRSPEATSEHVLEFRL
jgi:hypothetical protein